MDIGEKLEKILSRRPTRFIARIISKKDKKGRSLLGEILYYYGVKKRPILVNLKYGLFFLLISAFFKNNKLSKEAALKGLFRNSASRRALVNTAKSIADHGLTRPQVFSSPFLVVWNFTNKCNLSCIHCYQDAKHKAPRDELPLEKQLSIVDELADNDIAMIAFSGGEPLVSENFWKVSEHAYNKGFHLSVATNGVLLNKDTSKRLYDCGIRYIEVSLDSTKPQVHDKFRGAGCWDKTVNGIKDAVSCGMKVGLASTITQYNFGEFEELIKFSKELGCHKFCMFNFIPVGRAKNIVDIDLTPQMREEALKILYKIKDEGEIDIITTAPQMSRVCLEMEHLSQGLGVMTTAHVAGGKIRGLKMFAKYMGGCGAGRCYCAIQPDGIVTPCVFFPLEVGDLKKQKFSDIWNNDIFKVLCDRDDRKGACTTCDFKIYCGGCRARPYNYFGDLRESDPGCIRNLDGWERVRCQTSQSPISVEEN